MAARSTDRFAHAVAPLPVEHRCRIPFRPIIEAPSDFPERSFELNRLDRELDRLAFRPPEFLKLLGRSNRAGVGIPRELVTPSARRRSPGAAEVAKRQLLVNQLELTRDPTVLRMPWSLQTLQRVHEALRRGVGGAGRPGELRTAPYNVNAADGRELYVACPPERIAGDLQALLDWLNRTASVLQPSIAGVVLFHQFQSIRPFGSGNVTVGRALFAEYLRAHGLRNVGLTPFEEPETSQPELYLRLMLWTEYSGSYLELIDFATGGLVHSYEQVLEDVAEHKVAALPLEETSLRLLVRARHEGGWFSVQDAALWVGQRSGQTVLRHLNRLAKIGVLESAGRTRAKRYRLAPSSAFVDQVLRLLRAPVRRGREAAAAVAPARA
ncbi:MAG TPA: Fic family protein [Thermoplasmata archaeon]|nr:Fic family protein [Thermoplasmata archaeon]